MESKETCERSVVIAWIGTKCKKKIKCPSKEKEKKVLIMSLSSKSPLL